ncbi:hypothetical protein F0344_04760 [Streptomyces finlayi]|uniref:Minor tail protein n=1 Tax=Streptomyces finlayi TaxID=67296 RepID=A0A7G7BF88_9ACTN|nr:hypothetical protein [Streptomyces finlayi]QNE74003.1 hypothetical protein F0344_04760 [Streptomyces finlayi]
MAIQANALPPSLLAELNEMKRRLTALERKPKLGSVNERLPYGSYQSPSVEGTVGPTYNHTLGIINSTGLNQPVLLLAVPFSVPWANGARLDVSVTLWIEDMITGGKTKEFTLDRTSDFPDPNGGFTRTLTYTWLHPQPIGFDDLNEWKGFRIGYRVNKRVTVSGVSHTIGIGEPQLATGLPAGTYVEESTNGNPRIDAVLTPVPGAS